MNSGEYYTVDNSYSLKKVRKPLPADAKKSPSSFYQYFTEASTALYIDNSESYFGLLLDQPMPSSGSLKTNHFEVLLSRDVTRVNLIGEDSQ